MKLAETVDGPFRSYCQVGEFVPIFSGHSDHTNYEQEGDSLVELLETELEIDYEAAEDLANLLQEIDPANPGDGEEAFYSIENSYHRSHLSSWKYSEVWENFCYSIQHERRFFDEGGKEQLSTILGGPGSTKANELPVIELGPSTRAEFIFRARSPDSQQDVVKIIANPASELGPPCPFKARAGRMNPVGISVFYGALSQDTAIAEVRPSVGSLAVVGTFRIERNLRLLDLSKIGVGFTGSIFAPDYEDRVMRRRFLERFHTLIAKPIRPEDEAIEYIPTQAVAEYVSNALGLDGILYASAQIGAVPEEPEPTPYVYLRELSDEELGQYNVVFFGNAGIVSTVQEVITEQLKPSSLTFQAASTEVRKILSVSYRHQREYIPNPNEPIDFSF